MSDTPDFSDSQMNLKSTDMKEIENHYRKLVTYHINRSKLPAVYGWTRKVMNEIVNRIGKSQLEIAPIADHMDLPTRTLQRHLSQEGTNFSKIRDDIRRHYAIKFLLDGKKVEDIYPLLDFKDRTGLINAFKRWTGLPPHHFRKLYNIYVKNNQP